MNVLESGTKDRREGKDDEEEADIGKGMERERRARGDAERETPISNHFQQRPFIKNA